MSCLAPVTPVEPLSKAALKRFVFTSFPISKKPKHEHKAIRFSGLAREPRLVPCHLSSGEASSSY
jgi:hypothetical protein